MQSCCFYHCANCQSTIFSMPRHFTYDLHWQWIAGASSVKCNKKQWQPWLKWCPWRDQTSLQKLLGKVTFYGECLGGTESMLHKAVKSAACERYRSGVRVWEFCPQNPKATAYTARNRLWRRRDTNLELKNATFKNSREKILKEELFKSWCTKIIPYKNVINATHYNDE